MATRSVIGLDIGSTSIRAVEARYGKGGVVLTGFGTAVLPQGAVQGGVIEDDAAVIAALKKIWETAKFRSRDVVLGVTNRQVVVREMSVSNLPDRELRKSLPFQVRQVLPLPVEQSILDFYRLEDPGTSQNVRGLLIAAPKQPVLTAVQTTERAGLRVARVDLASFALLRAVSQLDSQVEAIVDIGARTTTVLVHADGEPLIVRTIPRGGDEITDMMAKRLGVEAAEAESIKCRVGLGPDADPKIAIVARVAVRPLVSEIRSSFAYLTSGEQHTQVTRLALSGGGALLPGLAGILGEQLGVEVLVADPLARLGPAGAGHDAATMARLAGCRLSAAVAIGLTLVGTP